MLKEMNALRKAVNAYTAKIPGGTDGADSDEKPSRRARNVGRNRRFWQAMAVEDSAIAVIEAAEREGYFERTSKPGNGGSMNEQDKKVLHQAAWYINDLEKRLVQATGEPLVIGRLSHSAKLLRQMANRDRDAARAAVRLAG